MAGNVEGLRRHRADQDHVASLVPDGGDRPVEPGDEIGRVELAIGPEGAEIDAADVRVGAQGDEGGPVGGRAAGICRLIGQDRRAA